MFEGFESAAELEAHLAAVHGADVFALPPALAAIHGLLHETTAAEVAEKFETTVEWD
jgi:hypothetical protein